MDYQKICETRNELYTAERGLCFTITDKVDFDTIPVLFRRLMSIGLDIVRAPLCPNTNTENKILNWKLNALAEPFEDDEDPDELSIYRLYRDEINAAVNLMEFLYNDRCMLEAEVEELRKQLQAR